MPAVAVKRKWRPSLAILIASLCGLLVALPAICILASRLIDNQFVRETERSLQAQAALFAEAYVQAFSAATTEPQLGRQIDEAYRERQQKRYDPAAPSLTGRLTLLPPRGEPLEATGPLAEPYATIAEPLSELARRAKRRTLIGYVATDAEGRIIASSGEAVGSLRGVEEIEAALAGNDAATLRRRGDQQERHPLTSISRNTSFRVFVAHPVVVGDRVVGAVMLSRTPTNLGRFLYRERFTLVAVGAALLLSALIVGTLFWRLISRPIRHLAEQGQAVADQSRPLPEPLRHYGVRELAALGDSVLSMAKTLNDRAGMIQNYTAHVTHELKSPTTAIIGAAEMLETDLETMPTDRRTKLIRSIHAQGLRMDTLLERLRTMTRARLGQQDSVTPFGDVVEMLRAGDFGISIEAEGEPDALLPLAAEQAFVALSQMAVNARQHGATEFVLQYDARQGRLCIRDNGTGIDPDNRDRVLDPFFTTRREAGGTGMGLAIAATVFEASNGALTLGGDRDGASFVIEWPAAPRTGFA